MRCGRACTAHSASPYSVPHSQPARAAPHCTAAHRSAAPFPQPSPEPACQPASLRLRLHWRPTAHGPLDQRTRAQGSSPPWPTPSTTPLACPRPATQPTSSSTPHRPGSSPQLSLPTLAPRSHASASPRSDPAQRPPAPSRSTFKLRARFEPHLRPACLAVARGT